MFDLLYINQGYQIQLIHTRFQIAHHRKDIAYYSYSINQWELKNKHL